MEQQTPPQFTCLRCGAPLGAVQGRYLIAGGIILVERTSLRCEKCHAPRVWKPVEPKQEQEPCPPS